MSRPIDPFVKDPPKPPGAGDPMTGGRWPNTYHVRRSETGRGWFVYRANVGGDAFFLEEYETKMAAEWRAAELRKREEEDR